MPNCANWPVWGGSNLVRTCSVGCVLGGFQGIRLRRRWCRGTRGIPSTARCRCVPRLAGSRAEGQCGGAGKGRLRDIALRIRYLANMTWLEGWAGSGIGGVCKVVNRCSAMSPREFNSNARLRLNHLLTKGDGCHNCQTSHHG